MTVKHKRLEPIHPGQILLEDFMKPMGVRINRLARAITADTALRLGKYFGVSPEAWMGLQANYDLRIARRTIGDEVDRRVQHHPA